MSRILAPVAWAAFVALAVVAFGLYAIARGL